MRDQRRHPAALADAISRAWHPYRWRAYVVGIAAGLLVGGVVGPLATTSLLFILYFAGGGPVDDVPWAPIVWTIAFAVTVPPVGTAVYLRWQPALLRMAAQTYIWLVRRAEDNWARLFGATPVPRDEAAIRASLQEMSETTATSGERFGLYLALLQFDDARRAIEQMPNATPRERFDRAAAHWLADFTAGATEPLEPLQGLADLIDDPDEQLEAAVTIAVNRGRVALSEGGDWQAPLAEIRGRLGDAPEAMYRRLMWGPTFSTLLRVTSVGVIAYWLGMWFLQSFLPAITAYVS
jgi:hypothetical protein